MKLYTLAQVEEMREEAKVKRETAASRSEYAEAQSRIVQLNGLLHRLRKKERAQVGKAPPTTGPCYRPGEEHRWQFDKGARATWDEPARPLVLVLRQVR